jgi:hypothetical protein
VVTEFGSSVRYAIGFARVDASMPVMDAMSLRWALSLVLSLILDMCVRDVRGVRIDTRVCARTVLDSCCCFCAACWCTRCSVSMSKGERVSTRV